MASIIGREWDDDSGVPAVKPRAGNGRGFTEKEQAAIQEALAEGRVTRIERGCFPDSARPDLYPRLAQARETMERRRRR
jgi:hypothetical protein